MQNFYKHLFYRTLLGNCFCISDIAIYLFVEKSVRGCFSYTILSRDTVKSIINTWNCMMKLYGWAITQHLSYKGFECLNQKEILITESNSHWNALEVYLEYDSLQNDYLYIAKVLQWYCASIWHKYWWFNTLVPNLVKKSNYVFHNRSFQLYLSIGMKSIGIHKILKSKKSDWLKKYIDLNTDKRKNAVNSFKKDFFKLVSNSVYDKTMKNLRKS